jgi:hypothetical protein
MEFGLANKHFMETNFYLDNTYHLHFISEGAAEASRIFLRVAHVLPKLLSYKQFWQNVNLEILHT